MQQLVSVWSGLELTKRVIAVAAAIVAFVVVLAMTRLASEPSMSLLYSGLEAAQAGDVIRVLEQNGTPFEVRGGAIYVDESQRDALRMSLAAEGLPANSGAGYELLDKMSGFGTTSQMFDAAYWRAKEGELARTIVATPDISKARVHIAATESTPFRRNSRRTASVAVTARSGGLADGRARALRFLVASAVGDLDPSDVTVIDATTGQVLGVEPDTATNAGGDKAQSLKANVERLLEARVGPGNAIVEVSVETVTESENVVERRIDPDSRVAISTDVEEINSQESNSGAAGVTVASNLPTGDAAAGGGDSQSQNSETRERTNFEVSELTREVTRVPGAVRRLTVAVLLNGALQRDANGTETRLPRDQTELDDLRDLVASAVGFDESRGDVITIRSLIFDAVPMAGTEASQSLFNSGSLDAMRLIQIGVLALVALALGLFVVRPVLAGRQGMALPAQTEAAGALLGRDGAAAGSTIEGSKAADNGEVASANTLDDIQLPDLAPSMATVSDFDVADFASGGGEQSPVAELKQLIEERQPDTIEILRSWLDDAPEKETA